MIKDGTYIPEGDGMYEIIKLLVSHSEKLGVKILTNNEVIGFNFSKDNNIDEILIKDLPSIQEVSYIISCNDYHNTELLLPTKYQSYNKNYWNSLEMCPDVLLFHLSLDIELKKLHFHNLFFYPFEFYVNRTSAELNTAPVGCDTLFILIPFIKNLDKSDEDLYELVLDKISLLCEVNIRDYIKLKRKFKNECFTKRFNAFRGNAYGLACNFNQIAIFRPSIKSMKINNLYFGGQMTNPGPGIPPCMVSGIVSSEQLFRDIKEKKRLLNISTKEHLEISDLFYYAYIYLRGFILYTTHVLRMLSRFF
jgi:phytoene desaturase